MNTMRVGRIRDPPDGGTRILVDRLWPRGISKQRAALDDWAKDLTPSNDLRKAFHDGMPWEAFEAAYRDELADADFSALPDDAVLLTAVTRSPCHADILLAVATEARR